MTNADGRPSFPERVRRMILSALFAALSLVAGLTAALVLHYILYRIGLPGTPFIYVAF